MAAWEIPKSVGTAPNAAPFPWEAIQEINERSLELLVQTARNNANPMMLPPTLRDLLRQTSPDDRKRAAVRAYVLIHLEFRSLVWWEAVRSSPEKQFPGGVGRNPLPKRSAVPLVRTLLMTAREAVRVDREIACLMFGIQPQLAGLLSALQITEIDRIAGHYWPHMQFRWLDSPAVWRSILPSAAYQQSIEKRRPDVRCLQLLIGDLLPIIKADRSG